jgi:hypothetical protein
VGWLILCGFWLIGYSLWLSGPASRWTLFISPGHEIMLNGKGCELRSRFQETMKWIMLCTCACSTFYHLAFRFQCSHWRLELFSFKMPCLHLCGTALSLSGFVCQLGLPCLHLCGTALSLSGFVCQLGLPCLHVCGTAFALSGFVCQLGLPCPLQPVEVMAYVVVPWVMTLSCLVGTSVCKKHATTIFSVFKQDVPRKHWCPRARLYGVTSFKTTIWIFATLKTPTFMLLWLSNNWIYQFYVVVLKSTFKV